ncbi:MAG: transposase [bacterium]|nr:transposase [bacterium]
MEIRERRHRLSTKLYRGKIIITFTVCIAERYPLFAQENITRIFSDLLINILKKEECEAHVFLFMPDHFHVLVEGKSDESDLLKFIKNFKQKTGYWLGRNHPGIKWQKDFYDHVLRKDEDILKQVKYILNNPVRKGLAADSKGYPFKGSTVYNLEEW